MSNQLWFVSKLRSALRDLPADAHSGSSFIFFRAFPFKSIGRTRFKKTHSHVVVATEQYAMHLSLAPSRSALAIYANLELDCLCSIA